MDQTKQNIYPMISIGAVVLGFISLFLPWVSILGFGELSVNGFTLLSPPAILGDDRFVLTILMLLVILMLILAGVLAVLKLIGQKPVKLDSRLNKTAGVMIFAVGLIFIISVIAVNNEYGSFLRVAFGTILAMLMGIVIFVASFLETQNASKYSNVYYPRPTQPPYQQPNQWQSPRQGPQQPYQQPGQWQAPQQPPQQPYQQQPGQWQAPQQPSQQPYQQQPGQWQPPRQEDDAR